MKLLGYKCELLFIGKQRRQYVSPFIVFTANWQFGTMLTISLWEISRMYRTVYFLGDMATVYLIFYCFYYLFSLNWQFLEYKYELFPLPG